MQFKRPTQYLPYDVIQQKKKTNKKTKNKKNENEIDKEHYSKQFLFFKAFQIVCRFWDIKGQRFAVLVPKIPNYVINVSNFGMMRLISTSGTIPLLLLVTKY